MNGLRVKELSKALNVDSSDLLAVCVILKINYDGQSAIINFKNEISEEEIHSTLVSMIKDIKE